MKIVTQEIPEWATKRLTDEFHAAIRHVEGWPGFVELEVEEPVRSDVRPHGLESRILHTFKNGKQLYTVLLRHRSTPMPEITHALFFVNK